MGKKMEPIAELVSIYNGKTTIAPKWSITIEIVAINFIVFEDSP